MASIKDLNRRITSLKNMQKVMRAMNMIATIKLRKLFALQEPVRLFLASVERISTAVVTALGAETVSGDDTEEHAHLILFTADKGLCGPHNNTATRAAETWLRGMSDRGARIDVSCIGLKGAGFCRRQGCEVTYQSEISERMLDSDALRELARAAARRYLQGSVQVVAAVYNEYESTLHQETRTVQLLPLGEAESEGMREATFAVEPAAADLAVAAAELVLFYRLQAALIHSCLSEQAARMTAMENATRNSEDLIGQYALVRNRVRQASITREIIEVVSGKEALRG